MPPKRQIEAKKSKWDFLKHPLLVAIVAATIGLIAVYLKSSSASSTINDRNTDSSNSTSVGGNNYGQVAGGNIINQTIASPTQAQQTNSRWQPPELPQGCDNIHIITGGDPFTYPVSFLDIPFDTPILRSNIWIKIPKEFAHIGRWNKLTVGTVNPTLNSQTQSASFSNQIAPPILLSASISEEPPVQTSMIFPVLPYVKNNRLYVIVQTPFQKSATTITMTDNLDSDLPANWDRNYSSNAFEIVSEDGTPVLQVIYKRANEIQVNGVFLVDSNVIFEAFGENPINLIHFYKESPNEYATTEVFTIADLVFACKKRSTSGFNDINFITDSDVLDPFLKNLPGQNPIFRYPSWQHLGEYTN